MDLIFTQGRDIKQGTCDAVPPALDWYKLVYGLVDEGDKLQVIEWDGDSLGDSLMNESALVVLRLSRTAQNGEMVAVRFKSKPDVTLGFYHRENGHVRLQPANPSRPPLQLKADEVQVQGQVIMILRTAPRGEASQVPVGTYDAVNGWGKLPWGQVC